VRSRTQLAPLTRTDLLGFHTHPGTADDYMEAVAEHIAARKSLTVMYHNLHTLYGYFTSPELKRSFDDTTIILDGMGVLFLYKLAGFSMSRDNRLTYVDFIFPMMSLGRDNGWRIFHIGQDSEIQTQAFDRIRDHAPGVVIDGQNGFFNKDTDGPENIDLVKRINEFNADLVLVGLGTPAQELWVDANRASLNSTVVMTCGSCMEYVAGKVGTAPRWMGRAGLEWLFRLFEDPRRFAWRYLVQPFLLFALLWKQARKNNKHASDQQDT